MYHFNPFTKKLDKVAASKSIITITAEENGNMNTNAFEWSFGNGNTESAGSIDDWGYVIPFDWELIAMSIGMDTTGGGDTSVRLTVNGNDTTALVTAPGGQTKAYAKNYTLTGIAGDVLNFRTAVAGGGNDAIISATFAVTI